MKQCMFCKEPIQDDASVCSHCRYVQSPKQGSEGNAEKSAQQVIGLVDTIVKWLGIPLTIILLAGTFFGIKQLNDITNVKNEMEKTAKILKDSRESLNMLLSRTIKIETEAMLDSYPLDSDAIDYVSRLDHLRSLVEGWDNLQTDDDRKARNKNSNQTQYDEVSLARALIAYRREKYTEAIKVLGDPPYQDGIWQRHLLASAYYGLKNYDKDVQHHEAMVALARNRGSISARAEQNLASALAGAGKLDEAIKRLEESLKMENRAIGRFNLAGILAKRGKPGDMELALQELQRAFAAGLCFSLERIVRDSEVGLLDKYKDYHTKIVALVSERGKC
jgi:tetratricopeptide (TPR) repeat protein